MIQGNLRLGVAAAALALATLSAFGFASAGRVTSAIGGPNILRGSDVYPARKDSVLQSGDRLQTPEASRLQWWMEDDSMLAMAPSSEVTVRRFASGGDGAHYVLDEGALRIVTGTQRPSVTTPVATIEAIGTDFSMLVCDAACNEQMGAAGTKASLYAGVDQGRIRVRNAAGSIEAVEGQVVLVASASVAPRILPVAPELFLAALLDLRFDIAGSGFVPEMPIQPIPPVELPGSPS